MNEFEGRFSPEVELQFRQWKEKRGVEGVLFDLDDTLISTTELFRQQFELFFEFCKNSEPHLEINVFRKKFKELDDNSYATHGVSLEKFDMIVDALCKEYGTESFWDGLYIIHDIYNISPNIFEGARETLDVCKEAGLRIGLITHATDRWTDIKLDTLNLRSYFDHVKVVNIQQHKHKTDIHWKEAIDSLGIDPKELFAVGDSLTGDVEAAYKAGVKTLAWISPLWHIYGRAGF